MPLQPGTASATTKSGASAIKCGSGRQSHLNVGVSCSRTGAAERSHDFPYNVNVHTNTSLNVSRRVASPALSSVNYLSRPNRSALCGRMKL